LERVFDSVSDGLAGGCDADLLAGIPRVFDGVAAFGSPFEVILRGIPFDQLGALVSAFVFYYPMVMAFAWMTGAGLFYLRWERGISQGPEHPPELLRYPGVSILIPCYNEEAQVQETIEYLLKQKYPEYEIVAINDGSRDRTLTILENLAEQHDRLRVINLASNQGKAMALRSGALLAKYEFLVCIDGDALLAPEALTWLMRHFSESTVGAVTGNPRIRTRSTVLGKVQVGEFSAIIGLIKRAQRLYGRIFTVSGVIAAFRRSALHQVGYWSNDMVTEDIDISWKLQLSGYDIRFEPNALCWVLMPETLKGLWHQRVRWAQGGAEVLLRYGSRMLSWSARRMWPIYAECFMSIVWAHLIVGGLLLTASRILLDYPADSADLLAPRWSGTLLSLTCLVQFAVSLAIDSRYESIVGGRARYYYWMVWYPVVYWLINATTTVAGCSRALFKRRGQRAVWVTLDRGISNRD
jgi:biofilm PGA synthesis N-glycosyltransferase PgaC